MHWCRSSGNPPHVTRSLKLSGAIASAALALAACGGATRHRTIQPRPRPRPHANSQRVPSKPVEVLVTAPSENRLLIVALPSGRIVRQVALGGEPEYAAQGGVVAVVSARSRKVTLLAPDSLRPLKVLCGFVSPHILALSPDDQYAYVTDDRTGKLTTIELFNQKVTSSIKLGESAHHMAFSRGERQVWVALGQSASTIAILSTVRTDASTPGSSLVFGVEHPRVIGRFHPGFLAHDLAFTPDGRRVWITSADTPYAGVFSARAHRLLFSVPAGPPPQHIAIADRDAYLTSGYGSRIEQVALNNGRIIRRAVAPYGSFELTIASQYVATVSLVRGTLAIYNRQLRLLRIQHLASSAEDVIPYSP